MTEQPTTVQGLTERAEEILGRPLNCGVDYATAKEIAIALVKEGATRREAGELLGIPERTVATWARKELGNVFVRKGATYYSEEFRAGVVKEYESGRMKLGECARHFGVNKSTVQTWAYGRARARDKPTAAKTADFKRRHQFHPIHNPNYELAPFHHLWMESAKLVAFVGQSYELHTVGGLLGRYADTRDRHMWEQWHSGRRAWARFDRADQILCRLGLWIGSCEYGELGPPTYGTRAPKDAVAA